mmetsp:Transcript_7268/g.16465  ORF Transcript_7268/g.16465 Transcript_7268/m.16465 type:complete len:138 (-) Transcript_7268:40-453(-)
MARVWRQAGLLPAALRTWQRPLPARSLAGSLAVPDGWGGRRPFTNWWNKYVDGVNPDRPHAVAVSAFLREEGIDPYLLRRDELEDFRKKYLTQFRWFAKKEDTGEKAKETLDLLREKHGVALARWRTEHALPPPVPK